MSLLIKNGEIVTASERYVADILCENDTITRIDRSITAPKGAEVIDAKGKFIFPGFIDPHVHVHLPFMGTYAKDTYETASKGALVGGTTTIIEMCCPPRSDDLLEGFEFWMRNAVGKSACDFTFHVGVSKFDDKTEKQLREIVKRGVSSFKVFLAYKGAFGVDDTELYRTLKLAKELGVIVTAHCENETLVSERCKELLAAGKTDSGQHYESRPPSVEAEGVNHLTSFAELTGAEVYIVHLSCKEALDRAIAARQRGVRVSVETLIQYLTLDKTYAELPKFEGAKYVMSPPLRDKSNQPVLWNGLRDGLVQTVATDHCPFDFKTQKQMGKNDFTKIPNGIPSLEERINLLYTYGVKTGKIDLHTFVNVASTQVAKTFDLFPRKGTIQPGADADLVVFDPDYRGKISAKTQHVNVDYNVFEGWKIEGRPSVVTVRGQVAVRDGKFVGKIGRGKFLQRKPSHF
ncbi:MAG TPA: dihydropyrimidinase [Candidatus Baltobacteraceae bacterium]|nr:dihydropyrimidinase [Candidatus Baltobacteraceae bacterium]